MGRHCKLVLVVIWLSFLTGLGLYAHHRWKQPIYESGRGEMACPGCNREPAIPGYHWRASGLYDSKGQEVASVIAIPGGKYASQACIFLASHHGIGCTYWETSQEAYDYVERIFLEEKK